MDQARRKAIVALARRLRASGTPLDGVGVQAHLDLSKGPLAVEGLRDMTRQLVDLGLEITITELDVKEAGFHDAAAARDQKVADETRRYLETMLVFPQVRGVVTWGLSDRHSWLSEPPQRQYADAPPNRGLPYDIDYRPKAMHQALSEALRLNA
ncbi:Endo-1,4-beta-xylanase A precursor [compost metagenome]